MTVHWSPTSDYYIANVSDVYYYYYSITSISTWKCLLHRLHMAIWRCHYSCGNTTDHYPSEATGDIWAPAHPSCCPDALRAPWCRAWRSGSRSPEKSCRDSWSCRRWSWCICPTLGPSRSSRSLPRVASWYLQQWHDSKYPSIIQPKSRLVTWQQILLLKALLGWAEGLLRGWCVGRHDGIAVGLQIDRYIDIDWYR